MNSITLHPTGTSLFPNNKRVLIRSFIPINNDHLASVINRALCLTEKEVESELLSIMNSFASRHLDLYLNWQQNFEKISPCLFADKLPSKLRQLYIGALFSGEYSFESTALFNPSIILHPNQLEVPDGALRFILSLRATGEGHLSSIEFRSGIITNTYSIILDPPSSYAVSATINPNKDYIKRIFANQLSEMGFKNTYSAQVINSLGDSFKVTQLEKEIQKLIFNNNPIPNELKQTIECIRSLVESNYEICFDSKTALSERIIFPVSSNERNGMEDARFVRFVHSDGTVIYYATYTAYNGYSVCPQILETSDFCCFRTITITGNAVQNKGVALFPRLIDGRYVMISRQDGENIFLIYSTDLHFWHDSKLLRQPMFSWEGLGIGNCGAPLETAQGWLVITHGIGPMRRYCISAMLLDLCDPSIILSCLKTPFITPLESDREGYVPNVVYSCGAMIHGERLIIPYGINDTTTTIVTIELRELFEALDRDKD